MNPTVTTTNQTPQSQTATFVPAGFWIRFIALMIDGLILTVVEMPLTLLEGYLSGGQQNYFVQLFNRGNPPLELLYIWFIGFVLKMVLSFFYIAWFLKNKGATPGKLVFDLKVLDLETGAYLTYKKTFVREFVGKILSTITFTIGYLMAGFRSDKRGLHYLIAGTQVLRKK